MKSDRLLLLVSISVLFHVLWLFRADLAPYFFYGLTPVQIDKVKTFEMEHPWEDAWNLVGKAAKIIIGDKPKTEPRRYACEEIHPQSKTIPELPKPRVAERAQEQNTPSEEEAVFRSVEVMPRFLTAECEDLPSEKEKQACSERFMLNYFYKNIYFPSHSRDVAYAGKLVIQFIVEKDGRITDIRTIREPGKEAEAMARQMTRLVERTEFSMVPGLQNGQAVRVLFNLPLNLSIE